MSAQVVTAIAGMEGALCSVIGGLVDCPVIGVPTSVGYGLPSRGCRPCFHANSAPAPAGSVVQH